MSGQDEFTPLLRGAGRYTADHDMAGAAQAVFVRSPHAHARILSIDTQEAAAMPGVVAVLVADHLGFAAGFGAIALHPLLPEGALTAPPRPPLARDAVRYVGEPVVLVVAETRAQAEDAAEAVMVAYDPLDEVAPHGQGPDLHDTVPGNVAMDVQLGDRAAVEAALSAAAHVAAAEVDLPRVAPAPMEPRATMAAWDEAAGLFHVWTPHQGAPEIQRPLSAVLGVPPEAIRVHATHVGGAFGARGTAYPEHAVLLAAARLTGRRLAWLGTRMEAFQSDVQGRGNRLNGRLALDAEGRFTAIDITFGADLGAWVGSVGAHINVKNPIPGATGCYAIPAAALRIRQTLSNAVPTGPYRGAGRPDIALMVERLVEVAARQTGRDPVALRRLNAVPAHAMPWRSPLGARLADSDFPALLDRAAELAGLDGFAARRAESAARGLRRGLGVGLFVEIAGGGAWPKDQVRLELEAKGGALCCGLRVLGQSTGQGHATALARVAAGRLGCRAEEVVLLVDDGGAGLEGSGAFGSRGLTAMGSALADAADRARGQVLAAAAEMLGTGPEALDIADSRILRDGTPALDLAEVVATLTQGAGPLEVQGESPLRETFPSGCHIAEVELDPETGRVTLARYTALDDCGRVIDAHMTHGQLTGGIVQGVGEALCEEVVYDTDGQLLAASFMDYAMPRADAMPTPRVETLTVPSTSNPLGAKGAGEAGVAGALTAVVNAVHDAMGEDMPAGRTRLPLTAGRLWAALATG